jgi:DNA-directed RNA polymerase subunit N (RpoN/RPB10)
MLVFHETLVTRSKRTATFPVYQMQDYTESNNNHMFKKLGTPVDRLCCRKVMDFASEVHRGLGGCGGNILTKQFAFLFS